MKKNFRKIPLYVQERVDNIPNNIQVACVKSFTTEQITQGALGHLEIFSVEELNSINSQIPVESAGRYSKWNLVGKSIVRKDLPKILKTYNCGERPYFGDYSKGSFTLFITKQVYPKEFLAPKQLTMMVQLIDRFINGAEELFTFKIAVGNPLNKNSPSFQQDLLFYLNLLQENVGDVNVFSESASLEEYLNTVSVDWEILPIGNQDIIVKKLLSTYRSPSQEVFNTIKDRYEFFNGLNPQKFIFCGTGLKRYFGALFSDNLVVFENLHYGNAIYIMFEEWKELSKLTRGELWEKHSDKFIWIRHTDDWKIKVANEIKNRLQ